MEQEINFIDEMDRDDEWLKTHMEDLVDQHTHKVIAILNQSIVRVGESMIEVQKLVAEQYPNRIPLIFEVPSGDEFECLL